MKASTGGRVPLLNPVMKKLDVLIVDDSSVMRTIVERSLRAAGFQLGRVVEAGNGTDALTVLDNTPVQMIFMDINMPEMDGIEFLRAVRTSERAKDIPVLMLTTEGSERKVLEAISLGARGYIRKPFASDEMRRQVSELLSS